MHLRNLLFVPMVLTLNLNALTLDKTVKETLSSSDEVKAITKNDEAFRLYVDEQKGAYYPKIDFQAYIEKKKEETKKTNTARTNETREGSFVQLNLEQVLYEGGSIDARVDESNHKYTANKYANLNKTENIVLNVIKSYLDLVKYDELTKYTKVNLLIQNDYLETAVENEKISGSALEKMQVESKISYAKSKLTQQTQFKQKALANLEKYIGKDLNSIICRPDIKASNISSNINKLYEVSLLNNYEIKEQIEKIKVQKALVEQEKAKYKPRIVAKLKKEIDQDLDVKDTRKDETSGRIELNYNLFNGFKDDSTIKRERKFLMENRSILSSLEVNVKEKVKDAFNGYNNAQDRIKYLSTYVLKNEEILEIYREQFEGGTRSFIDILNHENEIYRSKLELIEEEYNYLTNYYTLLFNFSNLTETIILTPQNTCSEFVVEYKSRKMSLDNKTSADVEELLGSGLVDTDNDIDSFKANIEDEVNKKIDNTKEVKSMLSSIMNDIYNSPNIDEELVDKIAPKKEVDLIKEINLDTKETKEDITSEYIKIQEEFKKDNSTNYTIAIATLKTTPSQANVFTKKYKIDGNVFTFKVGEKRDFVRVLYGAYESEEEATKALNNLHPHLVANKPYITSIKNQKDAYESYAN